jgi:hypothetical protein
VPIYSTDEITELITDKAASKLRLDEVSSDKNRVMTE